ncbi:hypothetical protein TNCV_1517821 [Trichonephila clavipes]|nr:hypothetical protein TNCV_1517821 [Trichonephila clavipes]
MFHPQTYPHSEEFSTDIKDDEATTVDSETELSLEQKLELAITKNISTNQNTIQRNQLYLKPSDEKFIYLKMKDLELHNIRFFPVGYCQRDWKSGISQSRLDSLDYLPGSSSSRHNIKVTS